MDKKLMTQEDMIVFKDYAVVSKGKVFIITKQPDGQIYSLYSLENKPFYKKYKKIKDLTQPHEMRIAQEKDYINFTQRLH